MKGLTRFSGITLHRQEAEGRQIHYLVVGYEDHGRPTAKVFVNPKCLTDDGRDVKAVGSRLVRTEKGNYVIVPDENYFTAVVGWESGYRGSSEYELLVPTELELPYRVYRSERGSLGISTYALITAPVNSVVKAKLTRTGRTYGQPKKTVQVIRVEDGELRIENMPAEAQEDDELVRLLGG